MNPDYHTSWSVSLSYTQSLGRPDLLSNKLAWISKNQTYIKHDRLNNVTSGGELWQSL